MAEQGWEWEGLKKRFARIMAAKGVDWVPSKYTDREHKDEERIWCWKQIGRAINQVGFDVTRDAVRELLQDHPTITRAEVDAILTEGLRGGQTYTLEEIKADFERLYVLKATLKGEIIGSVRAHVKDGTCFVARLVVHPDYQSRGIGTRLMHAIEGVFRDAERFEIFTGDRSEPALCLYRGLGYEEFKRKEMDTHTLVYLEKRIESKE